jgi:hypothetical protein
MLIPVNFSIGRVPKLPNGRHMLSGDVEIYILNGKKHRVGGPAEINHRTGYKAWFNNGVLHCADGPAVIDPVKKIKEFWNKGKYIKNETL